MTADKHGYYLEDLKVGMTAAFGKTVTESDIMAFAGVSGDTNPVHLHEEFAAKTMFKGRAAHGMQRLLHLDYSRHQAARAGQLPAPANL